MSAAVRALRAEYRADALGVGTSAPRLSWRIEGAPDGTDQVGYAIDLSRLSRSESTGRVPSSDRVFVDWPFAPLASREAVSVRVRAWLNDSTDDGTEIAASDDLVIEAGLLRRRDWTEPFVSPSTSAPRSALRPGYLLRAAFTVSGQFLRARIHATAHGVYTLSANGSEVSNDLLSPGWTSYRHRLRVQTYDVTSLLRSGDNVIGATLADGWYRGRIGFDGGVWDHYGHDVALLAQLELTWADGRVEVLPLATAWRWSTGPVTAAGLYEGETYDARLLPKGWNEPGYDHAGWSTPTLLPHSDFPAALEPAVDAPVRVTEELEPVAVERRPDGRIRLDFGQNIAGKLAISVSGPAGHAVRLHHAEVLEDDELGVRPLRTAVSLDTYVLAGDGREDWTPSFTVHGFRYAELEGWPGDLDPADVRALVVHSDMTRTGWFSASDPLLDRMHENVVWSMRGNFVALPTDCPNRDERLGWTGDIQVFAPAAAFLYDCAGTLVSWLRDLAAEQRADGSVPNYVPWLPLGFDAFDSAAWGDAAVIVPWTLFQRLGDVGVLREQWPSMTRWVEYLAGLAGPTGLIEEGFQLGDWLDPAAPPERPGDARTDRHLVANAYLIRSSRLVSLAAELVGAPEDARRFAALADRTMQAFRKTYVDGPGRELLDTPTALALAIAFDLLGTDAERKEAGRRLAELTEAGGDLVQTGFVGTPVICDALTDTGQVDAAYRLLLQRECPSWLYQVSMGATTTWERWDSMLPDGTINPGDMTSFNHYAFGAVADFLHRRVAGLAPDAPGYRTLRIDPTPGTILDGASATVLTPYGLASSSWRREGDDVVVDVLVPTGASATVVSPDGTDVVRSGRHRRRVSSHPS